MQGDLFDLGASSLKPVVHSLSHGHFHLLFEMPVRGEACQEGLALEHGISMAREEELPPASAAWLAVVHDKAQLRDDGPGGQASRRLRLVIDTLSCTNFLFPCTYIQ